MTDRLRRGFTMLTVLWLLAVASSLTVASATIGRIAVDTGRNRIHLDRAYWVALGCARRIQAAADAALHNAPSFAEATRVWTSMPQSTGGASAAECEITWEAAGARIDLNSATEEMLDRLLESAGLPVPDAERSARAVMEWKQSAAFSDARELARVPGYIAIPGADSALSAEPGRVFLGSAGSVVLISIPGITRETADVIVQRARGGQPIVDLSEVLPLISADSRDSLIARYPDAARLTVGVPDAWLLSVSAGSGTPPSIARLRWRLMRSGERVVVTQARLLP